MKIFDLDRWEEIWQTITRNPGRSIMTAFGVFWGIMMLTVMMGMGEGLKRSMLQGIGHMSTNTAFFFSDRTSIPYKGLPSGRWWNMDIDDIEAIKRNIPDVKYVSGSLPNWWYPTLVFINGDRKGTFDLFGEMPEMNYINPPTILYGRYINQIDIDQNRKVCLIGKEVYDELFSGRGDPTGQMIRMQNTFLTVVGVVEGRDGVNFSYVNRTVYLPVTTMQQILNQHGRLGIISVTGKDHVRVGDLEEQVRALLRERHMISPDDTKAVGGFNLGEEFDKFDSLFRWLAIVTWVVGIGTLLAGVVGVSNIMLVVVRERTQEIGVRRAIGATPRQIISQILSESFILTLVAGLVGLCAGVGILSIVEKLFGVQATMEGREATSYMISFGRAMISAAVIILGGVVAGLIPAYRAIIIKPVDAIREE